MIAAVRVRGKPDMRPKIRDALKILNLRAVNHCCVYEDNETMRGNLKKVSQFVTWGEIRKDLLEELKKHKGKDVELPAVFRLSPPKGGWNGKKHPYKKGGALGYRGEEIGDLIERMI